ncbi:MAG: GPR endopeptidase [Oscillospiraceae bacterium]
MNLRTDLAMEDHALWRRSAKRQTKLSGVRAREETEGGVKITSVEILDEEGERALGKPRGTYVTLECMPAHEPAAFAAQSRCCPGTSAHCFPLGRTFWWRGWATRR